MPDGILRNTHLRCDQFSSHQFAACEHCARQAPTLFKQHRFTSIWNPPIDLSIPKIAWAYITSGPNNNRMPKYLCISQIQNESNPVGKRIQGPRWFLFAISKDSIGLCERSNNLILILRAESIVICSSCLKHQGWCEWDFCFHNCYEPMQCTELHLVHQFNTCALDCTTFPTSVFHVPRNYTTLEQRTTASISLISESIAHMIQLQTRTLW